MSRSATDIANMACDFLDLPPMRNLKTDQSGHGKIMRRNYLEAVQTVIREFPWNCATTRAVFPAFTQATAPFTPDPTDHQYVYALPPDYLGLVDLNGRPIAQITHQIESAAIGDGVGNVAARRQVLWCDLTTPPLGRYKVMIAPDAMDPHLAKAIALELAQRAVIKAANSTQKMVMLQDLYATTTKGDTGRRGGHQVSSGENNPQRPVETVSRSERLRHGLRPA